MRRVRLSTGYELALDGDLLGLLEALYREVTLKRALQVSFEDMMREIQGLVEQMSEEERTRYLVESLFLNSVTYENEMLDAYMRRLTGDEEGRARAGGREVGVSRVRWLLLALRCSPPPAARTQPAAAAAAAPRIAVEPGRFDFGTRAARTSACRRSSCSATSARADLVIESVVPTCGCTAGLDATTKLVKPGAARHAARHARPRTCRGGSSCRERPGAARTTRPSAARGEGPGDGRRPRSRPR